MGADMAAGSGIGRPWLSCAAAPVGGIGPDSEERPGSGKLPVTTPSDFPGRSALRHG